MCFRFRASPKNALCQFKYGWIWACNYWEGYDNVFWQMDIETDGQIRKAHLKFRINWAKFPTSPPRPVNKNHNCILFCLKYTDKLYSLKK